MGPSVIGLIADAAAFVDRGMDDLDLTVLAAQPDPAKATRDVVAAMVDVVCQDAAVYKPLIGHWGRAVAVMRTNPVPLLETCFARHGDQRPVAAVLTSLIERSAV